MVSQNKIGINISLIFIKIIIIIVHLYETRKAITIAKNHGYI